MKILLVHKIILILILKISGCSSPANETVSAQNQELVTLLKDSVFSLARLGEFEIMGEIETESMKIKFYSVSEDEFLNAITKNSEQVRFFRRNLKINESNYQRRKGNFIRLGNNIDYIYLSDLKASKTHRARNYFLEGKVGDFFVVKRIEFESKETILVSSKTLLEEHYLYGLSASISPQEPIMFYCNTFRVTLDDEHEISFFKTDDVKIDTLLSARTQWFTEFSFFDSEGQTIYYIHSYFDDFVLRSSYARMDIVYY
jgi:hypothetical protein